MIIAIYDRLSKKMGRGPVQVGLAINVHKYIDGQSYRQDSSQMN